MQKICQCQPLIGQVSANNKVRDHLRELVQKYVDEDVRFLELDYQPSKTSSFWSSQRKRAQDHNV